MPQAFTFEHHTRMYMNTINVTAVSIAANKTLDLARERWEGIEPKKWEGFGEEAGTCPPSTMALIADALWTLQEIPSQIDTGKADKAFYALAAAQTVLWIGGAFTSIEIGRINSQAENATLTMA